MANVTTIYFLVRDKMSIFERMEKTHVAHLQWAIFVDVWAFSSLLFAAAGLADWGHEERHHAGNSGDPFAVHTRWK
jgi:hypothetical protein